MHSIKERTEGELIVSGSRFIGMIIHVTSLDEVQKNLSDIKIKYPLANHYCYAYILGDHQEIMKVSDDGEPQKTAGIPMLEVLKKQNLTDVLAVTVRYFGGKLLGASGLVRAYSKSLSMLLENIVLTSKFVYLSIHFQIDYKTHNLISSYIESIGNHIETTFYELIDIRLLIKEENYQTLFSYLQAKLHAIPEIEITDRIHIYE